MVPIEVSTGSRKNPDKRMAVLREKSGLAHLGTLEIGGIIARRGLGFSSIRMGISMRECGLWIRNMDRGRIGDWMQAS